MKRKVLTLLLALSLVCGSLAGCGEKEQGDKQGGGGNGESGEPLELTLWCTYTEASTTVLKKIAEKFNQEHGEYHITIENTGSVNQYRTKLATLKKSDYPSAFFGVTSAISEYATASYVTPLQKYIDADEDKWTEDMYESVRRAYSDKDGNLIGGVMGLSTKGYMVNVTALEAAGYKLEDVTSFEKLAKIAQDAVDKGVIKYGYSVGDGTDIEDMLLYQGVDIVDGGNGYTGEVTKSLYTEGDTYAALKKLLSIQAELYKNGGAYKNTGGTRGPQGLFTNGTLLFWTCTNSFVYELLDVTLDFEWAYIPHVGVDENAKYKNSAMVEGTGIFIANTENEAEMQGAYEFIKFLAKTENQVSWATYRGYLPYTKEAAASEEWQSYQKENFPSSVRLLEMIQNTSADLKFPYAELTTQILAADSDLNSFVMTDPSGDLDEYIGKAADTINDSIEVVNLRKQYQK